MIRKKARRFFVHDGVMYFKKTAKEKVCTCVCMLIQYILAIILLYIMHRLLRCDVSGLLQILAPAILTPLRGTCINCTLFLTILQSNGLDECFNQEMWDEYLDTYVYAYNTSVHDSTTFSPFEAVYFASQTQELLDTAHS